MIHLKDWGFELQLVPPDVMARSKNRVLNIEDPDGEYIKVQLQLENGEIVIAGYKCVRWYQPPAEIRGDMNPRAKE